VALLIEHHDGNGGDWLAHGADAEDGVGAHGLGGFAVLHALGFEPGDLAATKDKGDSTGDALVIDIALDRFADALEAFGGEADGFGLGGGEILGGGGNRQNQDEKC